MDTFAKELHPRAYQSLCNNFESAELLQVRGVSCNFQTLRLTSVSLKDLQIHVNKLERMVKKMLKPEQRATLLIQQRKKKGSKRNCRRQRVSLLKGNTSAYKRSNLDIKMKTTHAFKKYLQQGLQNMTSKREVDAKRIMNSSEIPDPNKIFDHIYRKFLYSRSHIKNDVKGTRYVKSKIQLIEDKPVTLSYCSKSILNKKYKCRTLMEDLPHIFFGFLEKRKEEIFLYPVSEISNTLDEFVRREIVHNEEPSFHSMNMELLRLGSFHNFPLSNYVSTLRLAREGFFYSGSGNEITCFECGFQTSTLSTDDDVNAAHRSSSPMCPILTSNSTSNIEIERHVVKDCVERSSNELQDTECQSTSSRTLPENESNPETSEIIFKNNNSKKESRRNQGINNLPSNSRTCIRTRVQQEKINEFIRKLDPLGIHYDRPKYPTYAVLAVRISSFTDWPSSISQRPKDLAIAGFLYAGYGDYTRCFFCGGGLRNWEPGDDPWTEHARWFPKCAFLRQNKGDEFVALVQIEHQEKETSGSTDGSFDVQTNGFVSSNQHAQNAQNIIVSTLPAFQSVLEMGYSSELIHKAFDHLKYTKAFVDVRAEELLEIMLAKDEAKEGQKLSTYNKGPNEHINDLVNHKRPDENCEGCETNSSNASDTKLLMEENKRLKDLRLCKICLENDASIAMLPCGHLCCCADCAPAMRKCPICRQFVKGTVRTWLV